jgi:protein-L-isoaspartate(D-aspartate) O-methyltransferase
MKNTLILRILLLLLLLLPAVLLFADGEQESQESVEPAISEGDRFEKARREMVLSQIASRGIKDERVLEVMARVPRHLFIPEGMRYQAYLDHPVRIGEGQTISQPYIVALMTSSLSLTGNEKVLEIGTGSGYQAAILGELVREIYTIEIKEPLYKRSTQTLLTLGYSNVYTRFGDGYFGWEEHAPFDCIMITAAVNHVPPPLLDQLAEGGRMILPLGDPFSYQQLVMIKKLSDGYQVEQITGVLFVPMTGEAQK